MNSIDSNWIFSFTPDVLLVTPFLYMELKSCQLAVMLLFMNIIYFFNFNFSDLFALRYIVWLYSCNRSSSIISRAWSHRFDYSRGRAAIGEGEQLWSYFRQCSMSITYARHKYMGVSFHPTLILNHRKDRYMYSQLFLYQASVFPSLTPCTLLFLPWQHSCRDIYKICR